MSIVPQFDRNFTAMRKKKEETRDKSRPKYGSRMG
jgi:hypothetical protein